MSNIVPGWFRRKPAPPPAPRPDPVEVIPQTEVNQHLVRVLAGDLDSTSTLKLATPAQLTAAADDIELLLTRDTVVLVLQKLARRERPDPIFQAWASLMRHGFVAGASGPTRPLEIEWEETYELAIADAVGRLDELGDVIDGTIDTAELAQLITGLSGP